MCTLRKFEEGVSSDLGDRLGLTRDTLAHDYACNVELRSIGNLAGTLFFRVSKQSFPDCTTPPQTHMRCVPQNGSR